MQTISLILFGVTYLGVALGRLPGLAVDRTSFALLTTEAVQVTALPTRGFARDQARYRARL